MASKMTAQHLQRLRDELARINGEIRTLEGRRDGLLLAIAVVNDDPVDAPSHATARDATRKPRGPLKEIVLRLLSENEERGLVAVDVVDLAKAQGHDLDRNSVSSLLSRFKRDGIVEYDGKKYRIPRRFPREIKGAA